MDSNKICFYCSVVIFLIVSLNNYEYVHEKHINGKYSSNDQIDIKVIDKFTTTQHKLSSYNRQY